jgi:hypothetical protein
MAIETFKARSCGRSFRFGSEEELGSITMELLISSTDY